MPDPNISPFAVVTVHRDGTVFLQDDDMAEERAQHLAADDRAWGHESHVISLHDLLAWVRANAREGRT